MQSDEEFPQDNTIVRSIEGMPSVSEQPDHTLWDISTPEEVAMSIIGIYPDPLRELVRRERFSRRQKNPVNLRFWAEVRLVIEAALTERSTS